MIWPSWHSGLLLEWSSGVSKDMPAFWGASHFSWVILTYLPMTRFLWPPSPGSTLKSKQTTQISDPMTISPPVSCPGNWRREHQFSVRESYPYIPHLHSTPIQEAHRDHNRRLLCYTCSTFRLKLIICSRCYCALLAGYLTNDLKCVALCLFSWDSLEVYYN